MLLIELFTQSHIHNITACLRLQPERLVFVGRQKAMAESKARYEVLLGRRCPRTKVSVCDIEGKDLGDICRDLQGYLTTGEECVIDLTGGDELAIMAVGAALAGVPLPQRQKIQVQKFDLPEQNIYDCIHDNCRVEGKPVNLSVEELITLYGGRVEIADSQLPESFSARDLDGLWQIVCKAPRDWNDGVKYLTEFEGKAGCKGLEVKLSLKQLQPKIADFAKKESVVRALLKDLCDEGVVELKDDADCLEYTYTDRVFHYCTRKAGNVLEIKTLLETRSLLDNGAPYFRDCHMGVSINWKNNDPNAPETRNEVDVVAVRGVTPLFISCKNGDVDEEEVYKLHTVTEYFGGPGAKMLLVATDYDEKLHRRPVQRMRDMGISLISNPEELTREGWREALREALDKGNANNRKKFAP